MKNARGWFWKMLGSRSLPRLGFYLSLVLYVSACGRDAHTNSCYYSCDSISSISGNLFDIKSTKKNRYLLHIKPREKSLGGQLKLRSCCIDWAIDQDRCVRFSCKDWAFEVNELFNTWLFLAKMIHSEVISWPKSFPSIKIFLVAETPSPMYKKVEQALWFAPQLLEVSIISVVAVRAVVL